MPPGTLERTAPSLFKQGPTALTRWALYSALALFLMVADARFHLTNPLRQAVAALLYPVQWVMLQPVELAERGVSYFEPLQRAVQEAQQARQQLAELAQRANQTEYLQQEKPTLTRGVWWLIKVCWPGCKRVRPYWMNMGCWGR